MSMRPTSTSKPGLKTGVPSEMFSNNGVIEFRTGVIVSDPTAESASPPPVEEVVGPSTHCTDGDCTDEEPDEECKTSAVKELVFNAVKAAVLAQNKATATTNAMRENAADDIRRKTIDTEMNMRRIFKQEMHEHQLSVDKRRAMDMRDTKYNSVLDSDISDVSNGNRTAEMRAANLRAERMSSSRIAEMRAANLSAEKMSPSRMSEMRAADMGNVRPYSARTAEMRAADLKSERMSSLRMSEMRSAAKIDVLRSMRSASLSASRDADMRAASLSASRDADYRTASLSASRDVDYRTASLSASRDADMRAASLSASRGADMRAAALSASREADYRAAAREISVLNSNRSSMAYGSAMDSMSDGSPVGMLGVRRGHLGVNCRPRQHDPVLGRSHQHPPMSRSHQYPPESGMRRPGSVPRY
jgi:hypothetical protein